LDEFTNELKIADATGENWFVLALKLKFPSLRAGQVIRIRSATYDETTTQRNVLNLQHYSNILRFVSSSGLAKNLASKVKDDGKLIPSAASVISEVDKKHAGLATTSLNDLFHQESSLTGNTVRTSFQVVKVEGTPVEMVKAYNKATKKTSSAKGAKGDLVWSVSVLAKDASTWSNNNKYRM
jgi:hypothetical protein